MTTKRIVYKRSDGIVEVVCPAPARMRDLAAKGNTEDEAIAIIQINALEKLPERGYGPAENVEVMEKAQIPQTKQGDRAFRNALEKPGMGPPIVNMPKARDIQTKRINEAKRISARDLIEREMMGEDIATEKAALRAMNMLQAINAAQTPEALSVIWPAGLARP